MVDTSKLWLRARDSLGTGRWAGQCRRLSLCRCQAFRSTGIRLQHRSKQRCATACKSQNVSDLALINVDYISPSLWLGVVLGITGMVLYSLKFRDARGTTEGDIVAASLFVMCGGILTLQGWRLDPILMLSEFVLGGVGIFYMVQTVNLRKKLEIQEEVEQERSRMTRWSLPRQPQSYASFDNYEQLPEGGFTRYNEQFEEQYQQKGYSSPAAGRPFDQSWPRKQGWVSGRQDQTTTEVVEEAWIDDYNVDAPYGVDTSSPKGRVSPETWKQREP